MLSPRLLRNSTSRFLRVNLSMSDEKDFSPREQQRIFGAGIKRRRIDFVPATIAPTPAIKSAARTTLSISPGGYLNIVLKNSTSREVHNCTSNKVPHPERIATRRRVDVRGALCGICDLPIDLPCDATSTASTNHESTIAHMVCLTHSHPPSHLDRNRQGLKVLSSFGWDPDSRQGLGATGKGIRALIKAKVKNDSVGLGAKTKRAESP